MLVRILAAVSDAALRRRVRRALGESRDVLLARKGPRQDLWQRLRSGSFDVVIAELSELGPRSSDAIADIRDLPGAPDVVVLAPGSDPEVLAQLLGAGAIAVLPAGLEENLLADGLRAVARRRLDRGARDLRAAAEEYRLGDFVSRSPAMRSLLELARKVVASDTSLLVLGETGVGKEWLARAIHAEGPRGAAPFLAVNCAGIPEGLIESELFGHVAGAFTGATRDHRGYFEMAHGGTLFLDEIAEMPVHLQAKLLRTLQERTFRRVGAEKDVAVDVRILAATNRDPEVEMREGRFREDLFYRLGVVTLEIPPLRARREDVRDLVENYLAIHSVRLARHIREVAPEAMASLERYRWPGNVRELINVMERAVLLAEGARIELRDLPEDIARVGAAEAGRVRDDVAAPAPRAVQRWKGETLRSARRKTVGTFERQYLAEILEASSGRVGVAARLAGVTPRALYELMRRHDVRKEDFRMSAPDWS